MRRNRPPRPFPYAERARAVEDAREAVEATFRAMRAARVDRNDPTAPAAIAWRAAAANFHLSIERAYPHDFWESFAALRRGERSGMENAIGFLEADPWFFRSGYIKSYLLQALKKVMLERSEQERLRRVLLAIVDRRDGREFRAYCRLAVCIATLEFRRELLGRMASPDRAVARRAGWMSEAIDSARAR